MTHEEYLIDVGIRSSEYTYERELLRQHSNYFKKCCDSGLSAYKALLFFDDYLKGDYEFSHVNMPSHIEAGQAAKEYADEMNSRGERNGFHELDFYNGTLWLRDIIDGKDDV